MPNNNIHIGELNIRVPGMSRREAQSLGEQVAKHLSENVTGTDSRKNIASLNVNMQHPGGSSRDHLARMIAENIARRIR